MSSRGDAELLADMQEALRRIAGYTAGLDYAAFAADAKTQDAVIRNLEVLGEAAKLASDAMRARLAGVPWKSMAGARDRLIHDYFGVNLDIVWQIVTVELPAVADQLGPGSE
jgi:uncharacterized protein with HEPN domain